ncbi:MAG: hypothetical protein WCL32_00915 [Planctomycetota bacterium]|jgi:hypothetical protein
MNLAMWLEQWRTETKDEPNRRRLLTLFDDAYQVREDDPDAAANRYAEGKELADRLGEAWWSLLFDKMRLDAKIHYQRDLRNVLEAAAACVREARRNVYAKFPLRWGTHDTLIAAYLGIDAEGYHEAISEELELLQKEIPPEPGADRYLYLARCREFEMERLRWEPAQAAGLRELDLAGDDPQEAQGRHFAAFTYAGLCQIAYQRRQWAKLEEFANEGEPIARSAEHVAVLAEILAWRAVSERYRDQREAGTRFLRDAAGKQNALQTPPRPGYFAARVAYYEVGEQPAETLHAYDEALASVSDHGQLLRECRLRVERLRVLVKLDRSLDDDLELARAAAGKLRFPEPMNRTIEAIEAGE